MKMSLKRCYGDATGPLGFPMRSDVAKEVEAALKKQPRELREAFRTEINGQMVEGYGRIATTPASVDLDEDSRTDVSLVSTASVDRDREVILPKGLDWSQFRRNMIVPFAHTYNALPIGRALWVRRNKSDKSAKDGWLAKTLYIEKPPEWTTDWFPDAVWWMVLNRVILGKSIGFLPISGGPPKEEDLKRRPEFAGVRWIVDKAIVLEYSIAPVPSNPDALVTEVGKCQRAGFPWPTKVLDGLGLILPEKVPTFETFMDDEEPGRTDEEDVASRLPKLQGRCRTVKEVQDAKRRSLRSTSFAGLAEEITLTSQGKL